jgi:glycerol-3-phosphate dehydrogenase (NAD(P)+)
VGGAVKNVLAIGAGLSDGLGFGANSRIALITRGLLEMMRLGVSLGAQRETFMGLAGLGDLVLTRTDDQSRNRRFGLMLGRGLGATAALAEIGQVVKATWRRALRRWRCASVSVPICEATHGVLYDALPADEVVRGLMMRPIKAEFDETGD